MTIGDKIDALPADMREILESGYMVYFATRLDTGEPFAGTLFREAENPQRWFIDEVEIDLTKPVESLAIAE